MKRVNYMLMTLLAMLMVPWQATAATWEAPTAEGQTVTAGDSYYLLNVLTGKFLAVDDNSTVVLTDKGDAFTLTANTDGTWLMSLTDNAGAGYAFTSDAQTMKVNSGIDVANARWKFALSDGNVYRFRPADDDENYGTAIYPGTWTGWANDGTDYIRPIVDEDELYGLTWKLLTAEGHENFYHHNALSNAMTTAQDDGLDITEALAVYNNVNSTYDELDAATAALNSSILNYNISKATLSNPVDVSALIANPSFEEGWTKSGTDITGWTQSPAGSFAYSDANINGDTKGMSRWTFGDSKFTDAKVYQKLTGMPNGMYRAYANYICIDQEPGNPASDGKDAEDYTVSGNYFYTITGMGTTRDTLSSGSRWGSASMEQVFYVTDGTLELGIEMANSTANWFEFPGVQLTYYGKDAMKQGLQNVIDQANAITSPCYQEVRKTLDDAIAAATALTSQEDPDPNALTEASETLTKAINIANENIAAYEQLRATWTEADSTLNAMKTPDMSKEVAALDSYMSEHNIYSEDDVLDLLEQCPYNTEAVRELTDSLELLSQSAQHSLTEAGDDITKFITNADFSNGLNGWTVTNKTAKEPTPDTGAVVLDEYTGEVSQTLIGMPNGLYQVSVQGFQRTDWNFESLDATWANGGKDSLDNNVTSYVFANSIEKKLKHAFDDGFNTDFTQDQSSWDIRYGENSHVMMPNTTAGANKYFELTNEDGSKKYFVNTVEAFVYDGTLTIGVRNHGATGAHWGVIDNFQLKFVGEDTEKATAMLDSITEALDHYATEKMNGTIKQNVENALSNARTVLAETSPEFDALISAIRQLENSVNGADESISAYANLDVANQTAASNLAMAGITDTDPGKELQNLYNQTVANYNSDYPTLTNDEITEIIAKYAQLAADAKVAKGFKAGDDITDMLVNPSFEDQTGLGQDYSGVYNPPYGWTYRINDVDYTTGEEANAAGLNSFCSPDKNVDCTDGVYGYCLQTANFPDVYLYQNVLGLPAGEYKVTVDMVVPNNNNNYRLAGQRLFVNNQAMYYGHEDEYIADSLAVGHPYETARTFGGYDEVCVEENGDLGDKGPLHTLSVTVRIEEGDTLTLGVRTDGHWEYTSKILEENGWANYGWCKFDNVRLYCVSLGEATGIKSVDDKSDAVSAEYYSVDGTRQKGLNRGVNIVKQTLSTGKTVTRKVVTK